MQALWVVNSFVKGPVKGNCRGSKGMDKVLEKENLPLPKHAPSQRRKQHLLLRVCVQLMALAELIVDYCVYITINVLAKLIIVCVYN